MPRSYKIIVVVVILFELMFSMYLVNKIYITLSRKDRILYLRTLRDAVSYKYESKARELTYISSDVYVEEYLRESLGYARPDERVFVMGETVRLPEVVLANVRMSDEDRDQTVWNKIRENTESWWKLFF